MKRFEPVGEQARYKYVLDWAVDARIGEVITYQALGELMGVTEKNKVQNAVNHAIRKLEENHNRTLMTERGVGYRVADVQGHIDRARRQRRKSNRALDRSESAITHIDLNQVVDENTLNEVRIQRRIIAAQQEQRRRLEEAQRRRAGRLALLRGEAS